MTDANKIQSYDVNGIVKDNERMLKGQSLGGRTEEQKQTRGQKKAIYTSCICDCQSI